MGRYRPQCLWPQHPTRVENTQAAARSRQKIRVRAAQRTHLESWRVLAIQLFPEYRDLYADDDETIWSVLFDQLGAVVEAHRKGDTHRLERIYGFGEWCYLQKDAAPELWNAAGPAFYEHLVDDQVTYDALPDWITPAIFQDLLPVFEHRLVNLPRDYGLVQPGSYHALLVRYDQANGTHFAREHDT